MLTPKINGEVVSIGNEKETSIRDLINLTIKISNSSSKIVVGKPTYDIRDDPQRRRPDAAKAKRLLGWEAKITLEEGLKRTIEWAKNNG